jgi:hypothetical protein
MMRKLLLLAGLLLSASAELPAQTVVIGGSSSNVSVYGTNAASPTTTVQWLAVQPTGNIGNTAWSGFQSGTLANPGDVSHNDFTSMLGWNTDGSGGALIAGQPALADSWENHWCPTLGQDCWMPGASAGGPGRVGQFTPLAYRNERPHHHATAEEKALGFIGVKPAPKWLQPHR